MDQQTLENFSTAVCEAVGEAGSIVDLFRIADPAVLVQPVMPAEFDSSAVRGIDCSAFVGLWKSLRQALETAEGLKVLKEEFMGIWPTTPDPIGGISGASFHEIGANLAGSILNGIALAAWTASGCKGNPDKMTAENIVNDQCWPAVKDYLKSRAPKFDFCYVVDRIRDESFRARNRGVQNNQQKAMDKKGQGMLRQEAEERLERLRTQGEKFTTQKELADRIGCSPSTAHSAIKNNPKLREWANSKSIAGPTPNAQTLENEHLSTIPQTRELSPEDDAAIREFVEKANPKDKALFLALSVDNQLKVVEDPEQFSYNEQVRIPKWSRKP
jgi:hypothetical protein